MLPNLKLPNGSHGLQPNLPGDPAARDRGLSEERFSIPVRSVASTLNPPLAPVRSLPKRQGEALREISSHVLRPRNQQPRLRALPNTARLTVSTAALAPSPAPAHLPAAPSWPPTSVRAGVSAVSTAAAVLGRLRRISAATLATARHHAACCTGAQHALQPVMIQ